MRLPVLLLGLTLAVTGNAAAQSAEEKAVRVPLEHYLQGHATGDGSHHRAAFHPEAKLFFIRDGKLTTRTSEEYIAGASGKPAADEAQRKRWIESVDIAGNAAVAKIILDYPTTRFVDYMSLLKVDGEWKIVNKTFYAEPKR
ncbi:MAG TPA: nuclear transport factor 2 family protein [Longimicrobiales bacterium]